MDDKFAERYLRFEKDLNSIATMLDFKSARDENNLISLFQQAGKAVDREFFRELSIAVATDYCEQCYGEFGVGAVISQDQRRVIKKIMQDLIDGKRQPNLLRESEEVIAADFQNGEYQAKRSYADFYMLRDGVEYFFELTTVRPDMDFWVNSKTKLLEWVARRKKNIKVFLAFPYNPYHPQPYDRFTLQNLLKEGEDFLVGKDY